MIRGVQVTVIINVRILNMNFIIDQSTDTDVMQFIASHLCLR